MISKSAQETKNLGSLLADELKTDPKQGLLIALWGDLGSGKTTFAKGLISTYAAAPQTQVSSPTFTLVHTYEQGPLDLHHFDLYRLKGTSEFKQRGLTDYLEGGICLIEWPDRITSLLENTQTIHVHFEHRGSNQRRIDVQRL